MTSYYICIHSLTIYYAYVYVGICESVLLLITFSYDIRMCILYFVYYVYYVCVDGCERAYRAAETKKLGHTKLL